MTFPVGKESHYLSQESQDSWYKLLNLPYTTMIYKTLHKLSKSRALFRDDFPSSNHRKLIQQKKERKNMVKSVEDEFIYTKIVIFIT